MKRSEAEILERYRIALENVQNQTEIATIMSEFGYDSTEIEAGKSLYAETRASYDSNKQEDQESIEAYDLFKEKKEALHTLYSLHRKKGKVIFRKDTINMEKLGLTGSMPQAYVPWLENSRKFYVAAQDESLLNQMARLKVTAEEITKGLELIKEIESARAEYLREKGESQDSTKKKDTLFAQLDDWMQEFYAVAKIALEDQPQLVEALAKVVRN